jgi:HAE1 family hydrophobic/amphiphilic exporter-1
MALVLVGGLWTLFHLQIELFPDIDFPLVTVAVGYPGADAEEVLNEVTIPIENAVSGLEGLDSVQSISSPGFALVIANFEFGTDMAGAARIATDNISKVAFADGVQPPRVARVNPDEFPVLQLSVLGNADLGELQSAVLSEIVPAIAAVSGVFSADVPAAVTSGNSVTRTNGRPSVAIDVLKEPDANTVEVVDGIMEALDQVRASLPGELAFVTIANQAPEIKASIDSLKREATLGALFAVIVIFVFLLSIRPTLVTGISSPVSIMGGLLIMGWQGMSLNMITLGALAVAVGRVVDDSIVVLENIYRHVQVGEDRVQAALAATKEVAGAITTSTLTTIAVFAPLAFIGGIIGAFFVPFALTMTFALLASLVVALTVVPVLGSLFIKPGDAPIEREDWLQRAYTPVLRWAVAHRLYTILAAVAIFVASLGLLFAIPQTFLPGGGQTVLTAEMTEPRGTTLAAMLAEGGPVERVEGVLDGLRDDGTVDNYLVTVGSGRFAFGPGGGLGGVANSATVFTQLSDEVDQLEVADLLRRDLAGDDRTVSVNTAQSGDPSSNRMELVFTGDDYEQAVATAERIVEALQGVDGLINVGSDAVMPATDSPELTRMTPISRVNGERAVTVSGTIIDVNTQAMNRTVTQVVEVDVGLPPGVELNTGGAFAQIAEAFSRMGIAMLAGIILVYVTMVVTLRSFLSPFVIILSLPLASIGALAALFLTQRTLGLPALIGMLMLIGLVVTNAIVLIVFVEQLRARGLRVYDALIQGGRTRLRPILMTAFTTSFALLPLAMTVSGGGIIGAELATVVIGGLMTSTFLTLLVIPVVYSLLRRDRAPAQVAGGSE